MSSEEKHNTSSGASIEASEFSAPTNADSYQLDANQRSATGLNRGMLASRADAPWWHSQFNLMLCVFGLLGVATLLFVLLTPAPASPTQNTRIDVTGESRVVESVDAQDSRTEDVVAPFSESQQEQARTDAQDILSELLDAKKTLENQGVLEWADDSFNAALQLAEQGDERYKQRAYATAIDQYKSALSALIDIEQRKPVEVNRRVALGNSALSEGKAELARERFQSALQLDNNHIPALQGLQRVNTLDQVFELIASAGLNEQDFAESDALSDIRLAKEQYQQASDLDSHVEQARDGLARATAFEIDKQYRDAMTQGFNALFAGRYGNARASFNQALEYKPEDNTASSALRQSLASDKRTSLRTLLRNAKDFEQQEQWASALSNYQTVLQRDRNQVSAKVGRIRAQARFDLDKALKRVIQDPLALSKATAREKAQSVLKDAQTIARKGPKLSAQIAKLTSSLQLSDTPVKVAFNSDALTTVTLKKAGAKRIDLGRFEERKLALKPGRYTLTGSRLGFRDVRRELELMPNNQDIQSFTIACNQLIAEAG